MSVQIILFCFLSLLLIIISYELKKRHKVPLLPFLVLIGLLFRLVSIYIFAQSAMIHTIDTMSTEVIKFSMLPAILFHAAFFFDWYSFKKEIVQTITMATTVVCLTSVLTGVTFKYILRYEITLDESFLLGVILNATDYVSVKSLFKETFISDRIEAILKGETLINSATVLVMFQVLKEVIIDHVESAEILGLSVRLIVVGFLLGLGFAFTMGVILKRFVNDFIQETNITIVFTYLLFWVCEFEQVKGSGGVAMVVSGLYMSYHGKTFVSPSITKKLHNTWNIFVNNIECLIFIIAGVYLGKFALSNQDMTGKDFGLSIVLFILLHVIRGVCLLIHYPVFKYIGTPLNLKEILVLTFAGIKGAISFALALMVFNDNSFSLFFRTNLLFMVILVSCQSIIIDSYCTKLIAKHLKQGIISDIQENILLGVTTKILEETSDLIEKLRSDKDFGLVKWDDVLSLAGPKMLLIEVMSKSEIGRRTLSKHPDESTEGLIHIYNKHFQIDDRLYSVELRRRFYSTLKGIYWKSYENGECFDSTVLHLVDYCEKSLDKDTEKMKTWESNQREIYNVDRIKSLKRFTNLPVIGKIFSRLVYDLIVKAYDLAFTFIRAHSSTEDIMDDMEKDLEHDVFDSVIEEAHAQVVCCQDFIKEFITDSYPDIIAEVQTKMTCFLLLNKQRKLVNHIYEQGVIKELEYQHLISSITNNLKQLKFMSKPEVPTLESVFKRRFKKVPFAEIQKVLPGITEKHFKPETTLYQEGSEVEGAYLIFSGIVHEYGSLVDHTLSKDNIAGAFHLIPGFGESYLSTAITQSVVIAAFIPLNTLNQFFVEDVYKESAKQFVLYHKDKFGLKEALPAHITKVVENSSVLHLYPGSPLNLRRGAIILKGRVRKEKEIFSLMRPSKKIIESLDDAIVMIFPPHFGGILKQHLHLNDAFASYYIKGPAKKVETKSIDRTITVASTFKINQLEVNKTDEN